MTPHHDGTQTEHGFASLFQMPDAGLGLVWLDGRAMTAGGHDGHEGSGDMSVRSAVFDVSGKQVAEAAVDLRVCECCPTAAAVTSDGPIVAYRNRSPEEIRDIYISRLIAGKWTEPVAVHNDGWKIAACPVNGPALSANGRNVAIAWFTAKGDEGHAYAAFSSNAGASFGEPIRLDDSSALGRVDMQLLPDGSALATWIEFADGRGQFKARRVQPGGQRSGATAVAAINSGRASGYPRAVRFGDELIFAWTETGETPRVPYGLGKDSFFIHLSLKESKDRPAMSRHPWRHWSQRTRDEQHAQLNHTQILDAMPHRSIRRSRVRAARVSEEIEERRCDAEGRH